MMKIFVVLGSVAAAAAAYYFLRNGRGEFADSARGAMESGVGQAKRAAQPVNDLLEDVVAQRAS